MMTVSCRVCDATIPKNAAPCPECGEAIPAFKTTSLWQVLGAVALVISAIGALFFLLIRADESSLEREIAASVEDAKRERKDRNAGIHCLSEWDGSHRAFRDHVKSMMRNPSSFEHIETRVSSVNSDGIHTIRMTYRAENGFGGMTGGTATGTYQNSDCSHTVSSVE